MVDIAVVGAGTMGAGIAESAALSGMSVAMLDVREEALNRGRQTIERDLERRLKKGRLSEEERREVLGRVSMTTSVEDCSGASLVIEAVVEDMEVKRKVFADLEGVVGDETVLLALAVDHRLGDDFGSPLLHRPQEVGAVAHPPRRTFLYPPRWRRLPCWPRSRPPWCRRRRVLRPTACGDAHPTRSNSAPSRRRPHPRAGRRPARTRFLRAWSRLQGPFPSWITPSGGGSRAHRNELRRPGPHVHRGTHHPTVAFPAQFLTDRSVDRVLTNWLNCRHVRGITKSRSYRVGVPRRGFETCGRLMTSGPVRLGHRRFPFSS